MTKHRTTFYLMAIPAFCLFFAFHTLPAIQGIFYSFSNYDGLNDKYNLVGLKNYINIFKDDNVLNSYLFTFKFAVVATILVNVFSLFVAVGLNAKTKFNKFFRGVYFLPLVLSSLIVGFIFNYLFSNIFPIWGQKLGSELFSTNILGNEQWAWIGIVIVVVWQSIAFNTILYLAGLQTIPTELYEASNLDGATKWEEFWKITFPLLAPFLTINLVLSTKGFLSVFDQIIALTGGGPGRATQSISILIYQGGFSGGEFAYQSANGVIFFMVTVVIAILQVKYLRKRELEM